MSRTIATDTTLRIDCRTSTELLPWFLNGSLEEAEQAGLAAHLADCPACSAELADTADLLKLVDLHVPSWDLAALGHGQAPSEWTREQVDRHLAVCPGRRRELAFVHASTPAGSPRWEVDSPRWEKVTHRTAVPSRRSRLPLMAAAAVAAFAVAGYGLFHVVEDPAEITSVAKAESGDKALLFANGFESGLAAHWHMEGPGSLSPENDEALFADSFESGIGPSWRVVSPKGGS